VVDYPFHTNLYFNKAIIVLYCLIFIAMWLTVILHELNITPRKSKQSVKYIFTQMFLKKRNNVKVKYLFNKFLRRCLNNWFRLSIFNITAQKQRKKQYFFANGLWHKNDKVNFFARYFSTIRHSAVWRSTQNAFLPPLLTLMLFTKYLLM